MRLSKLAALCHCLSMEKPSNKFEGKLKHLIQQTTLFRDTYMNQVAFNLSQWQQDQIDYSWQSSQNNKNLIYGVILCKGKTIPDQHIIGFNFKQWCRTIKVMVYKQKKSKSVFKLSWCRFELSKSLDVFQLQWNPEMLIIKKIYLLQILTFIF